MAYERYGETEELRHVPPLSACVEKLDGEVRRRVEEAFESLSRHDADLSEDDRADLDELLHTLIRRLDHISELMKSRRATAVAPDLRSQTLAAIDHALDAMRHSDGSKFRRRSPFHMFDRSRAEEVHSEMIFVGVLSEDLVHLAGDYDPSIDWRLWDPKAREESEKLARQS